MIMYYLTIILFSIVCVGLFYFPSLFLGFFALIIGLLTLIAGLGIWNMFFELVANFHPQLLIASLFFLIIALIARRGHFAILFALCAAVPLYALKEGTSLPQNFRTFGDPQAEASVRVMTLDMQNTQTEIKKLKERISEEKPTVISLSMLPKESGPFIEELKSDYPYFTLEGQNVPYNIAVLSKWPIQNSGIEHVSQVIKDGKEATFTILTSDICMPENSQRCVTLLSVMTPNIFCEPAYTLHQKILRKISQIVLNSEKNPAIVMGNLHTTPWTSTFQNFFHNAQLKNSAIGFPWRSTWRLRSPLFGLHLDHILVNKNVDVRQWWVGDSVGSDHYPVLADLRVKWYPSKPSLQSPAPSKETPATP